MAFLSVRHSAKCLSQSCSVCVNQWLSSAAAAAGASISITHSIFTVFTLRFFSLICFSVCSGFYVKCIAKPSQCQQRLLCFQARKCPYPHANTAKLCFNLSHPAECLSVCFFHLFLFIIKIALFVFTFWDSKVWSVFFLLFAGRDLWSVLTFAGLQFSSGKKKKTIHLPGFCIWSWFYSQRTTLFESISSLLGLFFFFSCLIIWITVVHHLKRTCAPSLNFADISQNETPPISNPPRLSSLYIGIYLFLDKEEKKKKKKEAVYNLRWRGENKETDPASLRGVNGIYYVDFLHAVHINPQRCQHTSSYHV